MVSLALQLVHDGMPEYQQRDAMNYWGEVRLKRQNHGASNDGSDHSHASSDVAAIGDGIAASIEHKLIEYLSNSLPKRPGAAWTARRYIFRIGQTDVHTALLCPLRCHQCARKRIRIRDGAGQRFINAA